ncbi:MAG: YIP1 family protein [Promethearchaeota archaeon]
MSISESLICHQCGERVPGDYVVCPYCGYSLVQILRQQFKVKVTIFESWGRIYRLLRYPRRTPEWMDQIATNYDRKGGIFVTYLIGAVFLIIIGVYFDKLGVPNDYGWNDVIIPLFLILVPLLGGIAFWPLPFIIWFTLSLFVWMFAKLLGGKGSFKETMAVMGYSFVPLIPGFLLSNLVLFLFLPSPDPSIGQANTADATIKDAIADITGSGAADLATVLLIFFVAWCLYIATHGIEKIHRIKLMESAGIAGGVAAIFVFAFYLL